MKFVSKYRHLSGRALNQDTSGDNSGESSATGAAAIKPKLSRFEFLLVKLGENERLAFSFSVESLCEKLAQMLVDMTPGARESAIKRLKFSNLASKPSIDKVIDSCHQKLKIASNCHLFFPKPKPGSVSKDQKDQFTPVYRPKGLAGG